MAEVIPKIAFNSPGDLEVEVMNFAELYGKLTGATGHDPFAVHRIRFYLILIVREGSYTHFVDFESYTLSAGSAIFIAPHQVHRFDKTLRSAGGTCIIFKQSFLERHYFLSNHGKLNRLFNYHIEEPLIRPEELGADSLMTVANQLYTAYHYPSDFAKAEMLRTLLNVLLLKAERAKEVHAVRLLKTGWLSTFMAFKDLLEREYTKTRSSRAYARQLFVSYKLLNDIVKHLTGNTVKVFIDAFVTTEIKRYLVSTALSVQEVSYKTGFEEPANMVKFFKRNTGTTPHKFRQRK